MIFTYKTDPFDHQRDFIQKHADDPGYALWWEPGTGKSKGLIDNAAALYCDKAIDGLFLLAPNGLHRNFVTKELPKHLPDDVAERCKSMFWRTDKASTKWYQQSAREFMHGDAFRILTMSYDGIMTEPGRAMAKEFLLAGKRLYGCDESQRIKESEAKRTVRVLASAEFAPFRRVMTGTPIANAPWDAYTQIKFVNTDFWKPHGLDSPQAMKTAFGEWETGRRRVSIGEAMGKNGNPKWGYEVPVEEDGSLVGIAFKTFPSLVKDDEGRPQFRDLERLQTILKPIRSRVLKKDVFDLPEKLHTTLEFELSPPQRRAYDSMVKMGFVLLEGGQSCSATMALTLRLRLQQIACGYIVTDVDPSRGEEPCVHAIEPNPRLDLLSELTEDLSHQALIWARFRPDIDAICAMLKKQGKTFARYDGAVSDEECAHNEDRFHRGEAQYFVSNQAKGGEGLTLIEAQTAIYYSNSFKLIERLQSSDRPHRYGQKNPVNEIDLVAVDTVDGRIVNNLQGKYEMAGMVTGDELRAWLIPEPVRQLPLGFIDPHLKAIMDSTPTRID